MSQTCDKDHDEDSRIHLSCWSPCGRVKPNVTPGPLYTRFNFLYSTVWTHEGIREFIESFLRERNVDFSIEWHLSGEPFLTPVAALAEATRDAVFDVTGVLP